MASYVITVEGTKYKINSEQPLSTEQLQSYANEITGGGGFDLQTAGEYSQGVSGGVGQAASGLIRTAGAALGPVQRGLERTFNQPETRNEDQILGMAADKVDELFTGTLTGAAPVREATKQQFGYKLAEGAGQLAGFASGAGLPGAVGKASPYILGAGAGGSSQLEKYTDYADKAGIPRDELEQYKQLAFGVASGVTEGLPIEKALGRFGIPAGTRIGNAAKQALLEGGQEGLTTFLSNMFSKGTFNPEQALGEGVAESAAVGGILGGAVGGIAPTSSEESEAPPATPIEEQRRAAAKGLNLERSGELQENKEPDYVVDKRRAEELKAEGDKEGSAKLAKRAREDELLATFEERLAQAEARVQAASTAGQKEVAEDQKQALIKSKASIEEKRKKKEEAKKAAVTLGDGTLPEIEDVGPTGQEDPLEAKPKSALETGADEQLRQTPEVSEIEADLAATPDSNELDYYGDGNISGYEVDDQGVANTEVGQPEVENITLETPSVDQTPLNSETVKPVGRDTAVPLADKATRKLAGEDTESNIQLPASTELLSAIETDSPETLKQKYDAIQEELKRTPDDSERYTELSAALDEIESKDTLLALSKDKPVKKDLAVEGSDLDRQYEQQRLQVEEKTLRSERAALVKAKKPTTAVDKKIEANVDEQLRLKAVKPADLNVKKLDINSQLDVVLDPEADVSDVYAARESQKKIAKALETNDAQGVLDQLGRIPQYKKIVEQMRRMFAARGKLPTMQHVDMNNPKWWEERIKDHMLNSNSAASYNTAKGIVTTRSDRNPTPRILIHELGHAAVYDQLEAGKRPENKDKPLGEAARDLNRTLKEIREKIGTYKSKRDGGTYENNKDKEYGTLNDHELISEALSNPIFQQKLRSIPTTFKTKKADNLLSKIIDNVANLLGWKGSNAFKDVMDAFDIIVDPKNLDKKGGKNADTQLNLEETPAVREAKTKAKSISDGAGLLWNSAADYLELQTSYPVVSQLGKSLRRYVDSKNRNIGAMNNVVYPAVEILRKAGPKSQLAKDFGAFWQAYTWGDTKTARELLDKADAKLLKAINAVRDMNEVAAQIAKDSGTYSRDADGKVKPWTPRDNFFPLMMNQKYAEALSNPDGHPETYKEITDYLINEKGAKDVDAAREMLTRERTGFAPIEGFFGNLERSRTGLLPPFVYDYNLETVLKYKDQLADRAAQIENFGQRLGEGKNAFQKAVASLKSDENSLKAYIEDVGRMVYGLEDIEGGIFRKSTFAKSVTTLGNLATFSQLVGLGGPAMTNAVGGNTMLLAALGPKRLAQAIYKLDNEFSQIKEDTRRLGIVREDQLNFMRDIEMNTDQSKSFMAKLGDKIVYGTGKAANKGLELSGFNLAEQHVRMMTYSAYKYELAESLAAMRKNPNSTLAKKFKAQMEKEGLDANKILLESTAEGPTPETDSYFRKMVNLVQGSYDLDQVARYANTELGKFFLKYYKFSQQATRLFVRTKWQPMLKAAKDKDYVLAGSYGREILAYVLSAAAGGLALNELRELIFGQINTKDDLGRFGKHLADKEFSKAFERLADVTMASAAASGALGYFEKGIGMINELILRPAEGLPPNRFVNSPVSAAGLQPVFGAVEFAIEFIDMAAKDEMTGGNLGFILNKFTEGNLRIWREGIRLSRKGMPDGTEMGDANDKKEDARTTKQYVQEYLEEIKFKSERQKEESGAGKVVEALTKGFNPTSDLVTIKKIYGRRISDALVAGDSSTAKQLAIEFTEKAGSKRDFNYKYRSLAESVEKYDPLFIDAEGQDRIKMQNEFLSWARKNLPEDEYARVVESSKTYTKAAKEAGLYTDRSKQKQKKEDQKSDAEWQRDKEKLMRKTYGN